MAKQPTSATSVAHEGNRQPAATSVALHIRIDRELNQLLLDFMAESEPQVNKTAVVTAALRRYLVDKREGS
jgi:hypothetical protein